MWPDDERPWYGTFIKTQADSLERIGLELDVLPIRGYAGKRAYADAVGELRRMGRRRSTTWCTRTTGMRVWSRACSDAPRSCSPIVVTTSLALLMATAGSQGGVAPR